MTDHAKALADALAELDEAYCRAGTKLTQAERHQDRKRLINARQVLAAYRATQQAAALDELIASGEEIDNALAQPAPSVTVGEREAALEAAGRAGLIDWVSDDGAYFTFPGFEVMSDKLVAFWRAAQPAVQAEPGWKPVPVEDLRKLAKLTEFNTSALAAHVAAMANKWLKSEPATTQPQPSPTQES